LPRALTRAAGTARPRTATSIALRVSDFGVIVIPSGKSPRLYSAKFWRGNGRREAFVPRRRAIALRRQGAPTAGVRQGKQWSAALCLPLLDFLGPSTKY